MDNGQTHESEIKFSVIIPTYNAEQTIGRTLDSVLAQSYSPHEIIIVDDASTDNTRSIIERQYPSVQYIQKIGNSGSSATRNKGMDTATGNYIAFIDADDVWHKDKLMLISAILQSKPGISLLYHAYTLDDINGKAIPEDITVYKLPFIKLLPSNAIATPCVVIRNDPSFRFEPTMRYSEDYDLWLRIGYKYKLYFIQVPLTQLFRPINSEGGISSNKWEMRKGEMRAYWRVTKLNPFFIFLVPALLITSIGKHLVKKVTGK